MPDDDRLLAVTERVGGALVASADAIRALETRVIDLRRELIEHIEREEEWVGNTRKMAAHLERVETRDREDAQRARDRARDEMEAAVKRATDTERAKALEATEAATARGKIRERLMLAGGGVLAAGLVGVADWLREVLSVP